MATNSCARAAGFIDMTLIASHPATWDEFMIRALFTIVVLVGSAMTSESFGQDSSPESALQKIQALTRSAAALFRDKEYVKSAAEIEQAQQMLEQLAAEVKNEYSRIDKAHKLLIDNGQKLPELVSLADLFGVEPTESATTTETPVAAAKTSEPVEKSTPSESQVSFSNDVVPVLAKHCGNCHIRQARGQFSASSYAALIKGTRKGPAVVAGEPEKSSLVTLVESKKMPPRSPGIPAADLQTLRDWVAQGAAFDGEDENAKITVPGGPPGAGRGNGPVNDD